MIIPVALFIMLYPAMLEVEFRQMKRAMRKPGLMLAALFMNFFFSPFLIFGLLQLLLAKQDKTLMIGLVLYGIMPCGAMVPTFTSRLRGNVALSAAILTVSLIFSLGIVPLWCKHLIGTLVVVPFITILKYLFVIVGLPFFMARLTHRVLISRKGKSAFIRFRRRLEKYSDYGLMFFLFFVFGLNGRQVIDHPMMILKIFCPVFLFLCILIAMSSLFGKLLFASREDAIALTMSTTPKNNAISMALAFSVFGTDVALVNAVAGPLVQLPIMLGYIRLCKKT
jgi:ACR3 family arsenite efflux pump ArsB